MTAAIVVAGVIAAVALVLVTRGRSTTSLTGPAASIAAQPSFGASLPVSTPAAASSRGSGSSAGDAELSDPSGVAALLSAATDAIQAVDSYDYRHLDKSRAAGDAVSTGGYRGRYDEALASLQRTAGKAKTVQQATVQKIAVTSLAGDQAGVLAFGRLDVTDSADPAGTSKILASGVSLQRSGSTWLISDMTDLSDQGTFAATPPGNRALVSAVTAGAREVVDLLSYSRTSFDADFNRAIDGLTGPLRIQQLRRRGGLEQSMNSTQTDYAGQVRSVGVESASGSSVLLLVCATGYSVRATGKQPLSGTERFEVGVEFVGGRWLVSSYVALPSGL